ncbi:GNAT family N-acetyltransferase [Thiocystis violacea]|uniref:GNAT family N-acetyltransferase n=1 Tax=Thiocystis violacea TaxID=13725 RepID=UPI0019070CEF|nr:GNAT family N-acetyltransferase [Thiocystis violacea]MBK1716768.1 GNAT family N-acetyltransferase [Thiocystis violacea]
MYKLTTHSAIAEIPAADWNRLADPDTPFLRHEFLAAMETHGCVGERLGWIPQHLALRDAEERILALAPCYLKFNSYGEFVFDWSWADAYRRSGRAYYPKLVVASPYTPATGPRILTGSGPRSGEFALALIQGANQIAERLGVSSLHWLFTTEPETELLESRGLMRRVGCQFHWRNQGYATFDDFLGTLTAAKRKMIKRERRRVEESGLRIRRIPGQAVSESEWATFHQLYRDTFDKRGGLPTLTLPFFLSLAESMGDQLLLVLAYHGQNIVAAAFDLVGRQSLYGRHWGCFQDYHSLHFEACYYQGLDYCIERGLARFEPGAQGEHKVSRGFLPTATWSAHWIADPRFGSAISGFLESETKSMDSYLAEMRGHSPYRADRPPGSGTPIVRSHP